MKRPLRNIAPLACLCLGLAAMVPAPSAAEEVNGLASTRSAEEAVALESGQSPAAQQPRETPAAKATPAGPAPGQTGLSTAGLPQGKDVKQQARPSGKAIYGDIIIYRK